MRTKTEITDNPKPDDLAYVSKQLSAFNDKDVGAAQKRSLAVIVRDGDGKITAAISGYTAWGWLYMQWLWVDEVLRGQRMAGQMLDAAEKEAINRGCHGALIDTFSPVAAKVYQRHGYEIFGELADFPIGRRRLYLKKSLTEL